MTQSGAVLFFQLINRRYGRASTVLTSNKGFTEWGRILGDEVMAAALLDRCHRVNIRGNSYSVTAVLTNWLMLVPSLRLTSRTACFRDDGIRRG